MTRTVAVGSAYDDMRRVYEVVLAAQEAGISAWAGVSGEEIDSATEGYRRRVWQIFWPRLGSLGLEVPGANPPGRKGEIPESCHIRGTGHIHSRKFRVRIGCTVSDRAGAENITKTAKNC